MDAKSRLFDSVSTLLDGQVFFIVGAPKSGTTWLQRCLNGHDEISCVGEAHFMDELLPELMKAARAYNQKIQSRNRFRSAGAGGSKEGAFQPLGQAEFRSLLSFAMALLLDKNAPETPVKWYGEKTPENIEHMEQLARSFPACRFVHIVRDGRDGAISAWFQNLRMSEKQAMAKFGSLANYAEIYGRNWARRIAKAQDQGAKIPDRYYELKFEDLHQDFDRTMGGLLQFFGVDTGPEALAKCREAGAFDRSSGGRQRGEEDRSSFYRKGEIGDWRNHFDESCQESFGRAAGPLLKRLGYN